MKKFFNDKLIELEVEVVTDFTPDKIFLEDITFFNPTLKGFISEQFTQANKDLIKKYKNGELED